jgi:hypothetical protein
MEGTIKQDGCANFETKHPLPEKYNAGGIKFLVNGTAWAAPIQKRMEMKFGLEAIKEKSRTKFYITPKTLASELTVTYLVKPNFIFGTNLLLDART